jgi:hypothetical protein
MGQAEQFSNEKEAHAERGVLGCWPDADTHGGAGWAAIYAVARFGGRWPVVRVVLACGIWLIRYRVCRPNYNLSCVSSCVGASNSFDQASSSSRVMPRVPALDSSL